MNRPIDHVRAEEIVTQLGLEPGGPEPLVLTARRDPTVVWANAAARALFGARDLAGIETALFGRSSGAGDFASRLSRLGAGRPYRLERVALAERQTPLVVALHAVDEGDEPLALLHVRSAFDPGRQAPLAEAVAPAPETSESDDAPALDARARVLWEVDAAGIVTRMAPEAVRLFGAATPRSGDDLPARLHDLAPALADRIAEAARSGGSVPLSRFDWASAGGEARPVEAGCVPRRGGPGLRGFFAVHGDLPAAESEHRPEADVGVDETVAATDRQVPDIAVPEPGVAEQVGPVVEPDPPTPDTGLVTATPPPPDLSSSAPAVIGNVVHFPVMRLGPVPANFITALHPAPASSPALTGGSELNAPRWSEAPPPVADVALPEGLSADEQDAFEHIRKVLGTRPFAAAPRLAPNLSMTDVQQLLDRVPLPLRLDLNGRTLGNAALRDRLGVDDSAAPLGQAGAPLMTRDGALVASEIAHFDLAGEPATLTTAAQRGETDPRMCEALDSVTDGHLHLDDAGTVLAASPKAARVLGRDARDLVGQPFAALLAEARSPGWQALAASGPQAPPTSLRLLTGAGQSLGVQVRLGRSGGGLVCALTLDRLAAAAPDDSADAARREAERTSALKSEFLAKVSHEIRTPLNAILGFAEVIRDERLGPVGNPRYLEYLRDIHASGTHVMSLVNDLLDLSRIEAGRMDLRLEAVDANAIVQSCVNTLQPLANRERIIVRLSLTPRLPAALADERSLRQIVLNLLSNAIKFNEPAGQVIVSTALAGNDAVAIRIRDTGIGMSEEDIEAAMEPFRQLSTVNRTGSGLGLPLTKALVEANCASMAIKSTRGEGTLVEVTFPLVEQDPVSLPAE